MEPDHHWGAPHKDVFDLAAPMENYPDRPCTFLVMSVWAELTPGKPPVWRGSIRANEGQRLGFSTLASLNRLVCELSGWYDPPPESQEDLPGE